MRWKAAAVAIVTVGLVSLLMPVSAGALTDAQAGGGDYQVACAQWAAVDGTGHTVTLCSVLILGAGYDSLSSPASGLPQAVVTWQSYCGTATGCVSYYRQAQVPPTEMSFDPLGRSATLAADVSGCQLGFNLQSSAATTDGVSEWPEAAAWPSEPTAGADTAVARIVLATGSGSVCNEPLAEGPVHLGIFEHVAAAGASYSTYGGSGLPNPLGTTWDITGRVSDSTGNPIAGATVTDDHVSTSTRSDGTYELKDYSVSLATEVLAYAPGYNGVVKDVTIVDAQQSVDFVLQPSTSS